MVNLPTQKIMIPMATSSEKKLYSLVGVTAVFMFAGASWLHMRYISSAWDLAAFDQAIYLISRGLTPFSTILHFHILGDHSSFILYPLALFYKIHPDVHWLFAIQGIALSLGAVPLYRLARFYGIAENKALIIAAAYLMYPLIWNISFFDFHPDVLAVPAILYAVYAVKLKKPGLYVISLLLIISCKAVFSLALISMGIWLIFFEKEKRYGWTAAIMGVVWFLLSTQIIIPYFGGEDAYIARHLFRYQYLGHSFPDILKNLVSKPYLILSGLFTLKSLGYLPLLFLPILWGVRLRGLAPLAGGFLIIVINLLSEEGQKGLGNQYSLPVLPFLFVAVIQSTVYRNFRLPAKWVLLWSFAALLVLGHPGRFLINYQKQHIRSTLTAALKHIDTPENVLTTSRVAPHLSQRTVLELPEEGKENVDLSRYRYILFNLDDPFFGSSRRTVERLTARLRKSDSFETLVDENEIVLFRRKSISK